MVKTDHIGGSGPIRLEKLKKYVLPRDVVALVMSQRITHVFVMMLI